MNKEELTKILELHEKWINDEEDGVRANLRGADLRCADLRSANLRGADLRRADLRSANLYNADLSNANLRSANLYNAGLSNANLYNANLSNVDLSNANLYNADLSNVDLSDANLSNADLRYGNLSNTILDEKERCRKGTILKEPLIGYKKLQNDIIATLEIPKGAIVFSINNSKCRTNKAKCISLSDNAKIGYSTRDCEFTYEINKEYEIEDFDLMYNIECSNGIHFFKTLKEAEEY